MDAIAVTDHGCVQAFPDANHAVDKGENFKILYGVEGYLVDDMKELAENEKGQTLDHTCVVFDIERPVSARSRTASSRSARCV